MTDFGIEQLSMEASDKAILREFVAAWDRHAQPVLFVGAGLSKFESMRRPDAQGQSRFGTWDDILDDFRQRLSNGDPAIERRLTKDPLRLAQLFEAQFGRRALLARVAHHVPAADFKPGEAHRRLREIPWAAVVTTNYDDLLERTFESTRSMRRIVTDEDLTELRPPHELVVIKLHGDQMQTDTIVITEEDYLHFETRRPGLSVKVRQLLIEHPLMFLGFSLADPNYARIDRWIRDTIGKVRLPAVSIVHGEPAPGERQLWKARGVDLVRLSAADSMPRLLEALASARPRRNADDASTYNERVHRLEAQVYEVAQEANPDRAPRVAALLVEILEGARTDRDGGAEARRVAVHFSWGWHILSVGEPPPPPAVTANEVYEYLAPHQRRTLLMLALQGGADTLRIDVTAPVDIARELLRTDLSNEERAVVHLDHARILRNLGRIEDATRALEAARACEPSKEVKARITLELRELVFQEGDAAGLEAELRLPLDDSSDVLAKCRRGSDSLLLGRRKDADRWYREAFERATTGDERVSALLGRLAAWHAQPLSDDAERAQMDVLRRDLRSIPEIDQPASTRAKELADEAGTALLDGKNRDIAIARLQRYLDEMRRLGWPHSASHEQATPIEIAARQCARLLFEHADEYDDDGAARRIKEGLVLLNRYGLAEETRKLFTHRHCEILARRPNESAWFRDFASARPTLQRCADTRLATALAGIALLGDDAIEATVVSVIDRIDAWLVDEAPRHISSLLENWWHDVVAACHHLTARAASRVLAAYQRYLLTRSATTRFGSPLMSNLWLQQGFFERGGAEARALAESGRTALIMALQTPRDGFWLRQIADCLGQATEDGLFSEAERVTLHNSVRVALETELASADADDDTALQLAALLADLHPEHRIEVPAFAVRAHSLVVQKLRSSELGLALHCAEAALAAMPPADRDALLRTLHLDENWRPHATPLARTLAAIANYLPDARDEIAALLFRMAEQQATALSGLGRLPALSREEAARTVEIAEAALFSVRATGRDRVLWSIAEWLNTDGAQGTADPILEVALGLCLSDAPETRFAAVYAVAHFFRVHSAASPALRRRALGVISKLAVRDSSWRVRVRALDSVVYLCDTGQERAIADGVVAAMGESFVAIERRVRVALRRRLAAATTHADGDSVKIAPPKDKAETNDAHLAGEGERQEDARA